MHHKHACPMFSFCIAQNIFFVEANPLPPPPPTVSDFVVSRFCIKFYVKHQQLSSFHYQRPNSWTQLDKSLMSFRPCYSQSPLLTGLKLIFNANIVYGNLKSENSQSQQETSTKLYVHEFGIRDIRGKKIL
jgi:hypothetical protein